MSTPSNFIVILLLKTSKKKKKKQFRFWIFLSGADGERRKRHGFGRRGFGPTAWRSGVFKRPNN